MNRALLQLALAFCLVTAGALCFRRFDSGRPSAEDRKLHLLPAAVGEFLEGIALRHELEERVQMNCRRILAKDAVLTEVLAGRMTLLQAAARFRDLDADVPEVRERLLQQFPEGSYEVALCRDVIERVRSDPRLRAAEQGKSVVARLEAELQAHLEYEGGLSLP